jgi:hypothetical protein
MSVESKLELWARQPGARVTQAEWQFIADMRHAAANGVGYGWMQQIIEWEWQSLGHAAFGPEYFHKRISALERAAGNGRGSE